MCMAACYWAGISKVIFCSTGADAAKHANFADDSIAQELATAYPGRKHMQLQYTPCAHNTESFDIYNNTENAANKYGKDF